jgi:hypothetical protein
MLHSRPCTLNYWTLLDSPLRFVHVIPPLLFHSSTTNSELYHVTPTHCCCVTSQHIHKLTDMQETCHVTATYCWCVMSPILRQLLDTRKTQLALLLRARIVFTELLSGNVLIKNATLFKCRWHLCWIWCNNIRFLHYHHVKCFSCRPCCYITFLKKQKLCIFRRCVLPYIILSSEIILLVLPPLLRSRRLSCCYIDCRKWRRLHWHNVHSKFCESL